VGIDYNSLLILSAVPKQPERPEPEPLPSKQKSNKAGEH
jgi:hypothetical protein